VIGGPIYRTDGSQHSFAELRRAAGDLGLEQHVGFTRFVPESSRAMRALDVVVHASTSPEPFGLAVAEAMACGRAVIAVDAGGTREIFHHEKDAIGVAPGDSEQLASALVRLSADVGCRERLGAAARRAMEQRFNRERLPKQALAIYRSVLESGEFAPSAAEISRAA